MLDWSELNEAKSRYFIRSGFFVILILILIVSGEFLLNNPWVSPKGTSFALFTAMFSLCIFIIRESARLTKVKCPHCGDSFALPIGMHPYSTIISSHKLKQCRNCEIHFEHQLEDYIKSDNYLSDRVGHLAGKKLKFKMYEAKENWDHDHCPFCGTTVSAYDNKDHVGEAFCEEENQD